MQEHCTSYAVTDAYVYCSAVRSKDKILSECSSCRESGHESCVLEDRSNQTYVQRNGLFVRFEIFFWFLFKNCTKLFWLFWVSDPPPRVSARNYYTGTFGNRPCKRGILKKVQHLNSHSFNSRNRCTPMLAL